MSASEKSSLLSYLTSKYHGQQTGQPKPIELTTEIFGNYCRLETPEAITLQEKLFGKYVREHQLIAAAASSSYKAPLALREALSAQNVKLLDKSKLVRDETTGEQRITELTSLMIACMMGNLGTAKVLIEQARELYLPHSPEDFTLFVNVKGDRRLGGNNALLYACQQSEGAGSEGNYILVKYLIEEAAADLTLCNDTQQDALLMATKRNQLNVVDLLFSHGVDINTQDK